MDQRDDRQSIPSKIQASPEINIGGEKEIGVCVEFYTLIISNHYGDFVNVSTEFLNM